MILVACAVWMRRQLRENTWKIFEHIFGVFLVMVVIAMHIELHVKKLSTIQV